MLHTLHSIPELLNVGTHKCGPNKTQYCRGEKRSGLPMYTHIQSEAWYWFRFRCQAFVRIGIKPYVEQEEYVISWIMYYRQSDFTTSHNARVILNSWTLTFRYRYLSVNLYLYEWFHFYMNVYLKEAKHLLFVIMYSMIVAFYIFHFQQRAEEWQFLVKLFNMTERGLSSMLCRYTCVCVTVYMLLEE